jgi:hypothetical protein
MKFAILFFLAALVAQAQTNANPSSFSGEISNPPVGTFTNNYPTDAHLNEQIRTACIEGRRSICGKILKVLPDGLVVESGYTNLVRYPLDHSWLVPGTVVVSHTTNLVESKEPGSICVGLVFLTGIPKLRGTSARPKLYDYVIIEGYPAGQYTYMSVGNIQRTVRRFSANILGAVKINLQAVEK